MIDVTLPHNKWWPRPHQRACGGISTVIPQSVLTSELAHASSLNSPRRFSPSWRGRCCICRTICSSTRPPLRSTSRRRNIVLVRDGGQFKLQEAKAATPAE
jgi:hypothetical protein